MKIRNFTFKPILAILFCILLFAGSVEAQELMAGSKDISTASATSSETFVDLGSITLGNLSGAKSVMVISEIEMQTPAGTDKDVVGYYTLSDGTNSSPEISRYVTGKSYDDRGLAAACNIFEYGSGFTGSKTFTLKHRRTVPGTSKEIASKANMVAIVIDDANVTLPFSVKTSTSVDETTSSTDYIQIPGVVTSAYALSAGDAVYLSTAFSTLNGGTAEYAIRYQKGAIGDWILISEISRTNSADVGAATITDLFVASEAGSYVFEVAHKAGSGTLTTRNITFIAVGLKDSNGNVYPHFKSSGLTGTTTSPSPIEIAGPTTTSQNASNSIFAHATFNLKNNDLSVDLNTAGLKLGFTNATFTPITLNRYIEANATGSGGLVGLASGIKYNAVPQISLYHNSDGTQSLTTSNVNIVGFHLKNTPKISAGGDWSTITNWSPNGIPAAKDNVVITGASTSTSGDLVCHDLVIAPTGSLNITGGTLSPGGVFTIESNATQSGSFIEATPSALNITYNRWMTGGDKWHLVSSPIVGQSINDFVLLGANSVTHKTDVSEKYALAPYNNVTGVWDYYRGPDGTPLLSTAGTFTAGIGYSMLRTADGTVAFTGTVSTTDVAIDITTGASNGWNQIGNPFPSAINAANTGISFYSVNDIKLHTDHKAIYVWNAGTSSYETVNLASGTTYLAPGQGFFVYPISGTQSVSFTADMRNSQTGVTLKSGELPVPYIKLIAERSLGMSSTNIKYFEETTTDMDPGYDAGRFTGGDNSFAVFTHLAGNSDNKVDLDIQCLPLNEYNHIIPVGLNSPQNTEVVFRAETMNLPAATPVILEDRLSGIFTDLTEAGSFYTITITDKTEGTGRFFLHTQKSATTGIDPVSVESNFTIIPHPQNNSLHIIGNTGNKAEISVYDMLGRKLIQRQLTQGGINEVDMGGLISGAYIVFIQSSTQKASKKISWLKQ